MSSRKLTDAHIILQQQFPIAKEKFEKDNKGVEVFITCSYRSPQEQTALYNQPFDKKDNDGDGRIDEADEKVTQAKALQSPHNYLPSFAIDVAFNVNGKLDWSSKYFLLFSKYMITDKIEWGGTWKFKDTPHYEIKGWKK
ncbi:MAG: M15 family metallopeptidase [Bacteroidia bacterium]|nr:M15 family metallopeptidase [Bacteroidia bacterium]